MKRPSNTPHWVGIKRRFEGRSWPRLEKSADRWVHEFTAGFSGHSAPPGQKHKNQPEGGNGGGVAGVRLPLRRIRAMTTVMAPAITTATPATLPIKTSMNLPDTRLPTPLDSTPRSNSDTKRSSIWPEVLLWSSTTMSRSAVLSALPNAARRPGCGGMFVIFCQPSGGVIAQL